jgi:hypothetical protein
MKIQKLRRAEFGGYLKQHMYLQEYMENSLNLLGENLSGFKSLE